VTIRSELLGVCALLLLCLSTGAGRSAAADNRTAIFYEDDEQKEAALASKESLERSGRLPAPIATEVMPLRAFYPAEAEHQDFYQRNVRRYWTYRTGCGRDQRLKQLWK
jgi:peptide-methionine (S)-S-oxide reductase